RGEREQGSARRGRFLHARRRGIDYPRVPAMKNRRAPREVVPHGRRWPMDRPRSRAMTPQGRTRRKRNAGAALQIMAAAIMLFGGFTFLHAAVAQETPYVPDEAKFGRRQSGSTLQYCLDTRDPDLPVARRIGRAIAEALLLTPKPQEMGQVAVGDDLDNL